MKNVFAYFFLLLFTGLSLNQALLFGTFILNQDLITVKFCVNKDKPELKCNGKCHLSDAIAIAEAQDNDKAMNLGQNIILPVFFQALKCAVPYIAFNRISIYPEDELMISMYTSKSFRPPIFLS